MEKHGLNMQAIDNLSYHCHRTVEQWLRYFEFHWERIRLIDSVSTRSSAGPGCSAPGRAAETFEAAREIINCYHVTFVKGHFAGAAP